MENLSTGIALTVVGMGLVFAVLIVLAGLMAAGLRLTERAGGEAAGQAGAPATPHHPTASEPASAQPDQQPSPDELAAIAIAVQLHQVVRRRQAAPAMRAHQPGALPSRWLVIGRARQNRTWERR